MNFRQITPFLGDQRAAFEELCCQLARRHVPDNPSFVSLHGAGGDGGVECFADLADGSRVGWQAKYVFNVESLITQATKSLTTALRVHPSITRFILCFPFDLTGPTERKTKKGEPTKSGIEKFKAWHDTQIQAATAQGRTLEIEDWPAAELRSLLMELDVSGGLRKFFFDSQHFSIAWFQSHLNTAKEIAGPRYHPELTIKTEVWQWFSAFGCTTEWQNAFEKHLKEVIKKHQRLSQAITRTNVAARYPEWPESLREAGTKISEQITECLNICNRIKGSYDKGEYEQVVKNFESIISNLSSLEDSITTEFDQQHGAGRADSPGFRQFMAEYELSFPAAHLDAVREIINAVHELSDWLKSASGKLTFYNAFVLSGKWGVGKTHGVCDVTFQRLDHQLLSCVIFGHQFGGEPDQWTRLTESLGLPTTIGKDELLDALNAAGEASKYPLVIFIDAINETRPVHYWQNRIAPLIQEISKRSYLKVCFTCRTPYLHQCLPEEHNLPIIEHLGFQGIERTACAAFFEHYGLKPPVAPILQPELANPLYLRLVCETLKSQGINQLPTGWTSTGQVIQAFLKEKEKAFSKDKGVSIGARIVTGSLRRIAREIAAKRQTKLSYSDSYRVIREIQENAQSLGVVEWLIGENLLIEEITDTNTFLLAENSVRPAFERLGDFLIAFELIERLAENPIECSFDPDGLLHLFVHNRCAIEENYGVLSALSILIPERYPEKELSDLAKQPDIRETLIKITATSIPGRDPSTFSTCSQLLIREALASHDVSYEVMDNLLAISWQKCAIDAMWLHGLLQKGSLAQRDAYWCDYLYWSYEKSKTVRRLIEAAFNLPLEALDLEIVERWSIVLIWMNASADRRIKDFAARALIKLLDRHTEAIPVLISRFLSINDDEVRERLLLISYGSLIKTRNDTVIRQVVSILQSSFRDHPIHFNNALIRDHIRCISELAEVLRILPEDNDAQLTMQPISSDWPLKIPTEDQVNKWGELLRFRLGGLSSDFFQYSMGCLRSWDYTFSRVDMAKWILQRVAHDFGYEDSNCQSYDQFILGKYGGGRAKPPWAERIAKKYQWTAMYQLASHLHDHIERKQDSLEPELLCTPLILLEERKLDPTLSLPTSTSESIVPSWWIAAEPDLDLDKQLSDKEWVDREDDIPTLKQLLSIVQRDSQNWRVLYCYKSWDQRPEEVDENEPYRQVWINIHSYLVRKEDFTIAYDYLHRRNFSGTSMIEGASWLYGFAGEYPWATSFNTEPEEWHSRGGHSGDLPTRFRPSWNELAVEWEYDATLPNSMSIQVPVREFFQPGDLWWNGKDGYCLIEGQTVFCDPSIMEAGPSALLMDTDDFIKRLEKLDLRIIWTLLGKKWILGNPHSSQTLRRTFSQIACLDQEGSLKVGECVFFDQN